MNRLNLHKHLFIVSIFVNIVLMSYTMTFIWDNFKETTTLDTLKAILNCTNKKLISNTYQKGNFIVLENYITNATEVECYESVTYSTHGGFEYLENLLPLVYRWMAPISVAVYAPGKDFEKAVAIILYLRQCSNISQLINKFVSFHLFFSSKHMPSIVPDFKSVRKTEINCSQVESQLKKLRRSRITYRSTNNLLYPINVARNIARDASTTHYLLASDIELYPSPNLVPQFLNMVALNPVPVNASTNFRVYPLPIFEIKSKTKVPSSKKELQRLLSKKKATPFHKNICPDCHDLPKEAQWIKANETPRMEVFHVCKRSDMPSHWEPIYIGTNEDPYYDERLSWEGMLDKITQGYIMCLKNYDFMILSKAFLVHKPGVKGRVSNAQRINTAEAQKLRIKNEVLPEYERVYGVRKECIRP